MLPARPNCAPWSPSPTYLIITSPSPCVPRALRQGPRSPQHHHLSAVPRRGKLLCHHMRFPTRRHTPLVCLEDAVLGELQPLLPGPPAGAEAESAPLHGHDSPSATEPHRVPSLTSECGSGPASPWGSYTTGGGCYPTRGGCCMPATSSCRRPMQVKPAPVPPRAVPSAACHPSSRRGVQPAHLLPGSLSCQIGAPLGSCGGPSPGAEFVPSLATVVVVHQPNQHLHSHCSHQRGTLNTPLTQRFPSEDSTGASVPGCWYNHPCHAAPTSCPGAAC